MFPVSLFSLLLSGIANNKLLPNMFRAPLKRLELGLTPFSSSLLRNNSRSQLLQNKIAFLPYPELRSGTSSVSSCSIWTMWIAMSNSTLILAVQIWEHVLGLGILQTMEAVCLRWRVGSSWLGFPCWNSTPVLRLFAYLEWIVCSFSMKISNLLNWEKWNALTCNMQCIVELVKQEVNLDHSVCLALIWIASHNNGIVTTLS